MNRIIIQDDSTAPIMDVICAIKEVIKEGRISNHGKCYCYITTFPRFGLLVSAEITKTGTDKFIVQDRP